MQISDCDDIRDNHNINRCSTQSGLRRDLLNGLLKSAKPEARPVAGIQRNESVESLKNWRAQEDWNHGQSGRSNRLKITSHLSQTGRGCVKTTSTLSHHGTTIHL